jgi:hypothetical protein
VVLEINPQVSDHILIPIKSAGTYLTVGALRDVDFFLLAMSVDLTEEQLEHDIRDWAEGAGLPYGVLAPQKQGEV